MSNIISYGKKYQKSEGFPEWWQLYIETTGREK